MKNFNKKIIIILCVVIMVSLSLILLSKGPKNIFVPYEDSGGEIKDKVNKDKLEINFDKLLDSITDIILGNNDEEEVIDEVSDSHENQKDPTLNNTNDNNNNNNSQNDNTEKDENELDFSDLENNINDESNEENNNTNNNQDNDQNQDKDENNQENNSKPNLEPGKDTETGYGPLF